MAEYSESAAYRLGSNSLCIRTNLRQTASYDVACLLPVDAFSANGLALRCRSLDPGCSSWRQIAREPWDRCESGSTKMRL